MKLARQQYEAEHRAFRWLSDLPSLLGAIVVFAWLPDSLWGRFLPSLPSKLFPPVFAAAFAAGWVVGLWRRHADQAEEDGAIRSHASITGLLTALVACFTAYTASIGPQGASLPFLVAAAFLALGLLPCALFATIGASFAHRAKRRKPVLSGAWAERERIATLAASAILPAVAVLVWPAVYGVGKFLEEPPAALAPTPMAVIAPPPPAPRYVKPEGFDAAHAWKRIVTREDAVPNVVEASPFVLSHDERRLAFVVHERGEYRLAVRQLYDPGPDRSLPLRGGVTALAWSPDDRRIIFLAADSGALWVCEPESGKTILLPIPVFGPNQRHNLVWWRDEDVLVYRERGEPGMLSLDSLRIKSASEVPDWAKLTEDERSRIGRTAFAPGMSRTEKVKFSFAGRAGENAQALALNDDESLYARFAATASRDLTWSFPNRDGTMFFIVESQRLRILYMGLRQSPQLRFVCEANEDFPSGVAVSAALTSRAIRAVVAAPVVNPLNGKTVDGDPAQIKGVARIIAASGKTCTVCIEQEREPVREGDVLFALTAIQADDEFYVSRGWWAVITRADDSQSILRRADVPMLLPSLGRELRPLPKIESQATDAAVPPTSPTASRPPASTTLNSPLDAKGFPVDLNDPEWYQKFIVEHYAKAGRRDIEGVIADYFRTVETEVGFETRDQLAARMRKDWSAWLEPESILGGVEVKHLHDTRFAISFSTRRTLPSERRGLMVHEYSHEVQIMLTPEGRKITSHIAKPPQPTRPAK